MAQGFAVLVGLTELDPGHYGSANQQGVEGCGADVNNMRTLLSSRGYEVQTFQTREATFEAVTDAIQALTETARAGDIVVLFFASHGTQLPDRSDDESDAMDETICLYDRELVDDDMWELLCQFRREVRILSIADTCNSGSVFRAIARAGLRTGTEATVRASNPIRTLRTFTPIPEGVGARGTRAASSFQAELIHFGAAADGTSSVGYQSGGAFTQSLCDLMSTYRFETYFDLFHAIERRLQTVYTENGKAQAARFVDDLASPEFRDQSPFTIGDRGAASSADEDDEDEDEESPELPRGESPSSKRRKDDVADLLEALHKKTDSLTRAVDRLSKAARRRRSK